ncbi:hypothetical protein, partial [Kitasatospora cheerisanensis]|uniref:hypothetical protein n=1 Tax=Kitasatospora cheerisanensis TaxID=81942 RepID=UPI001AD8296E
MHVEQQVEQAVGAGQRVGLGEGAAFDAVRGPVGEVGEGGVDAGEAEVGGVAVGGFGVEQHGGGECGVQGGGVGGGGAGVGAAVGEGERADLGDG